MIGDDIIYSFSGGGKGTRVNKNNLMRIITTRCARNINLKSKLKFYTHVHLDTTFHRTSWFFQYSRFYGASKVIK